METKISETSVAIGTDEKFGNIISKIRSLFSKEIGFIPLHAPYFGGNEKAYVNETIDSTFVSSVGAFVDRFESMMQEITGAKYAVATTNGTIALHLALMVAGVKQGDEVLTQALTFVATANAISHAGAKPIFIDVDRSNLGMSPESLETWLKANALKDPEGNCINRLTGKRIAACVPMHTFGFPLDIISIASICKRYGITLVEDAAESLGSYVGERHTGTFGLLGTFSFNGNKTVTCGGGGAVITNDPAVAKLAKHLSTTAKVPHSWEFAHDAIGYNYRMPNLNAALACAQLEQLQVFLASKRMLATDYAQFFSKTDIEFVQEQFGTTANYWLNTIIFKEPEEKEAFLEYANKNQVMCRPIWQLMNHLPMYAECAAGDLSVSEWLASRVVNIPSSYRP